MGKKHDKPLNGQKFKLKYNPNPAQEKLSQAINNGAKVILFRGGIRSGKTVGGVAEILKQIYTHHKKPGLFWIVSPTFPMSQVPERIFKNMVSSNEGSLILHERKGERAYELRPSSKNPDVIPRVEFKSADDPDRLRGPSVGAIVLDEGAMMSHDTFTICQGRVLDNDGIIIITTTPREQNWLYTHVEQRSYTDPRYVVIQCRTSDNPYLSSRDVEELYSNYSGTSDKLAKREMDAEWVNYDGLAFSQFRPADNIIREFKIPDSVPVICGIDWGFNDPFVCVWTACIDGVWVVLDEYYKSKTLLSDHAAYIKNHPLATRVKKYWCDPSRMQERMEFLALKVKPILPARRPDKNKGTLWPVMRARLLNTLYGQWTSSPFEEGKKIPKLVFFNNIVHGTRETLTLSYLRYSEDTKQGPRVVDKEGRLLDKNASEELEDKNNHFVDALGYAIFSEVRTFGGELRPYLFDPASGKNVPQGPSKSQDAIQRLRDEIQTLNNIADQKKKIDNSRSVNPFDTMAGFLENP